MSDRFFQLATPRDMLEKAKRERSRMNEGLNIDNIFNFFVTAFHVKDYVKEVHPALEKTVEDMVEGNEDFQMCRLLCHKGKHLNLRPPNQAMRAEIGHRFGAIPGRMAFNTSAPNQGGSTTFTVNGKDINITNLADKIIQDWERFFADHGIT